MDPVAVVGGLMVLLGGAWTLWSQWREAALGRQRRVIAEDLCLTERQAWGRVVLGRQGPLAVCMQSLGGSRTGTRVTVEGLARSISLRAQSRLGSAVVPGELQIGDHMFDAEVAVGGSSMVLRAVFDAPTRSLARDVFALDVTVAVSFGQLSAEIEERFTGVSRLSTPLVRQLLTFAERLQAPPATVARLASVAHTDPLVAVRRGALEVLIAQAGTQPTTQDALREATRDRDPELRLAAAIALGPEGSATLHELAADVAVGDGVSAAAIAGLGGRVTFARARPILDAAIAHGRVQTARAALRVMGRGGDVEARIIAAVLERAEGDVALAAVEALGDTLAPGAEEPLRRALERAGPIAIAAASGLARLGTVQAVADLKILEGRGGEAARAAREAIASIQSRLTGATPGQVSLASGESGQVSVVDSADGRVTLADPRETPR